MTPQELRQRLHNIGVEVVGVEAAELDGRRRQRLILRNADSHTPEVMPRNTWYRREEWGQRSGQIGLLDDELIGDVEDVLTTASPPSWLGATIPARTTPHSLGDQPGVQYHFWFPNGHGASVVTDWSQGGWEMQPLRGNSLDSAVNAAEEPLRGLGYVDVERRLEELRRQGSVATSQPQGFRGDLWRRMLSHFFSLPHHNAEALFSIDRLDNAGVHFGNHGAWWCWTERPGRSDIEARWRVYQDLKPLYDIVDGAVASALMPEDVEREWNRRAECPRDPIVGYRISYENDRVVARGDGAMFGDDDSTPADRVLQHFSTVLDAVAEARVAAAATSQPATSETCISCRQPQAGFFRDANGNYFPACMQHRNGDLARRQLTLDDAHDLPLRRFDAADLRRAISSDYEIVAVTPMRADPHLTPKDGRYRVDIRLLEARGYLCSATTLPRGVIVRYEATGDDTTQVVHGTNDSLVADLDDWASSQPNSEQEINEAQLRMLVLSLPNVKEITGLIERGSRQRDRYIVRLNLINPDVRLDPTLASRLPGNIHLHAQGRGDGGMRGLSGTGTSIYVPGSTALQPRRLDYDGLVALLRRHLGDAASVSTVRGNREGQFEVGILRPTASTTLDGAQLPSNVVVTDISGEGAQLTHRRVVGTSSQIFDPGRSALVAHTPQRPDYFSADGDTVTTPDLAPPWLHQMMAEMRARRAMWTRTSGAFTLGFELPYGHELQRGNVNSILRRLIPPLMPDGTHLTIGHTNTAAPRVPVCLVRAFRDGKDLAVLTPTPQEQEVTQEWCQLPTNLQRNVVIDIVEKACLGLSDEAAADRASCYHILIDEAKALGIETANYVIAWCEQFRTRAALLEVDDGAVAPTTTAVTYTHRTKVAVTAAQVRKFRDAWESKMCAQSATECAAAALLATGKVESDKPQTQQPDALAVHILTAWCTGLDDKQAAALTSRYHEFATLEDCDRVCAEHIAKLQAPLELSPEHAQEATQQSIRARQRADLASLQAELRKERLERVRRAAEEVAQGEVSRFGLLELDGAEDPAKSIKQWEATRQQRVVREARTERVSATPAVRTFTPPSPQHIDVPTPPHNGVEYVDAQHVSAELQEMVKWAGLAAAVGERARRQEN